MTCSCRGCTVAYNAALADIEARIREVEYEGRHCMVVHSCGLLDDLAGMKRQHTTGADILKEVGR